MFGDDHMEISRAQKQAAILTLTLSDKFREPLAADLVNLEVTFVSGGKRTPLAVESSKTKPSLVTVRLPKGTDPGAVLEIKAPRKTPIRGQVSTQTPQRLLLSSLARPR